MNPAKDALAQTRRWVRDFIVEYQVCPFARREVERGSVRYIACEEDMAGALEQLMLECEHLDSQAETETTLLVFTHAFADFDDFLDLIEIANDLLEQQGYLGTYQLAHFHPDYRFEGAAPDDAANHSNRAPWPTLHLIREASLERALASYPDPERIPERNIALMRDMGLGQLQAIFARCRETGG